MAMGQSPGQRDVSDSVPHYVPGPFLVEAGVLTLYSLLHHFLSPRT